MMTLQVADIEPLPRELMAAPLDWFFAEHGRHRHFCKLVNEAAVARRFDAAQIGRLLDFLANDLPLHVADEEECLFPLLRRRALPEDNIEEALSLLCADHKGDVDIAALVRGRLETCLDLGRAPGADHGTRLALLDFASHELHHLALENAVVLPIARLRLTPADLRTISRRLAARRGESLPRLRA
ncbi:hemerythrin domain-containing protein [Phenylobacterium sp.]|jgi:iron-sulfur cluster repair protein YtfE (RIC family)|uniref:hemerythrin domain-containing protein n=1 Tax=Phenylobacterium sp. TaxID=1871053 RepID=UPI00394E4390